MIEFECTSCGEEMGIRDRMAGRTVRCPECDAPVRVPETSVPLRRHGDDDRRPRRRRDDPGLSTAEWVGYTLLFLFIPCANVVVSSVLYYVWRADRPKRANQMNLLGFAVFGLNVLVGVTVRLLLGGAAGPMPR